MAAQELPRALYCGPNCEILQNVSHRKSDVSGTFRMAAGGVMNCCADVATLFVARIHVDDEFPREPRRFLNFIGFLRLVGSTRSGIHAILG
jgi:hypothetical protein